MATYDERGFITALDENEIFVFGSNGGGGHFGGAAATAMNKFGAIMGQAEGLQGQSYAINTMDGIEVMREQIDRARPREARRSLAGEQQSDASGFLFCPAYHRRKPERRRIHGTPF